MNELEQRIADLVRADETHNRLAVALTEWLDTQADVNDVKVVSDEVTSTVVGFTYDGRGYSLTVSETL